MSAKESIYSYINLNTFYITFDLYEDVDEAALLYAAGKAVNYHPLFGTRSVYADGLYYYETNPMPPVVFRADCAPRVYGTAENNYYPWMFIFHGKRIEFHTIHFLTDGVGMFNFCKTVLHLYFERMGFVFKDTETDFPKAAPSETLENAYERYADFDSNGVGTPGFAAPTAIAPELLHDGPVRPWRLIIPCEVIRKFASDSDTSVFSVISCILSRAMARAYGITSGNINIRVPVNLRSIFPSETDRNFAQGFSLCYMAERMNSMPDARIETAFRSQLDLWLEKGNLIRYLNNDVETKQRLRSDPEAIASINGYDESEVPRANILYTHITKTGFSEELLGNIADIFLAKTSIQKDFVNVFATSFRSDICLTIEQCSKGDGFIAALREVLTARGISYTLSGVELASEHSCMDTSALRGVLPTERKK